MAKPGPKPKPTVLRVIEGDPKKSRYNLNEPQFGEPDTTPPSYMIDPVAVEMWEWACPRLMRVGVLSDGDTKALEALCVVYAKWRKEASSRNTAQLISLLSEFGLTPSSRTRLVGKLPHEADADPIAARLAAR